MEGKHRADHGAALDNEEEDGIGGTVEQYRDFVVDGDIYQALDLGRRLLQLDGDHARRADAAQLLLERLRSNREDSTDHANALLRVLANYAMPTKELTEELLPLLFFCDHRVQIIHHLSRLTYQSRECVWLVVDAYIELLSSDRSLLVPILGSLADLSLLPSDKALIVDATESLLDAASEEDVPAVVQSLLSMLVPSAASRIVTKIRGQCNRLLTSTTLSLTFDVIMRHAVAGSSVLTAFLRAIRQNDTLTPFDLTFLALLLSRPSENSAGVRVVASLATRGALNRHVVLETLRSLRDQKWHDALRCCIRLASALLTACFNTYRSSGVSTTVQCAVDVLGYLVVYRTVAQEEALSLMMSMVSQPQRLVLSTSKKRYIATSLVMCWDVAQSIATQLAHIVKTQPASLAPFAHIFLDHLYGIAASSNHSITQYGVSSSYPASILASLCRTMVALTKHEPGMVSLLMITIQKQLVVPIQVAPSGITTIGRSQASVVVQLKQLMAVFLAGEMLAQGVGEKSERSSLLNWIQRLMASAAMSDETTTHVLRLLGSPSITSTLSTTDRDATSSLLSTLFTRLGFHLKNQKIVASRLQAIPAQHTGVEFLPGLSDQSASWIATSLVFDVITYVRISRLGEEPVGWHSLIDHESSSSNTESLENIIRAKTELLPALMEAFRAAASTSSPDSDTQEERALVCSFALPSVGEDTFGAKLPTTLWSYVCALQLAVDTTNALAVKQQAKFVDLKHSAKSMSETVRQRKRLLNRVQVCWTLHKRLRALLDEASSRLKRVPSDHDQGRREASSSAWLKLQINAIEKRIQNKSIWDPVNCTRSSLCALGERLSLQAVSAVFEGLWKQQASMIESGLEIELFRAFPARLMIQATYGEVSTGQFDNLLGFEAMEALVNTQDGKRTLKYLARRVLDYCELLVSLGEADDGETEDQDSDAHHTRHWVITGVQTLCTALRSIIEACRNRQLHRVTPGRSEIDAIWEETVMELFAKGASDMRIRRTGNKRTNSSWSTSCEIIFRSLANALVQSKHGQVACELMDVLLSLTGHTRRTIHLSQISLSLLHCPYPSSQSQTANSAVKAVRKLPVLDPTFSSAITDILRPMPRKYHHLSHFIIGAWAIPSTLSIGLNHVSYLVECVGTLITSTVTKAGRVSKVDRQRNRQAGQKKSAHDKEPDAEDDIDAWIARDGEHRVLKNLTHDTLPVFMESILACLASAPLRAIPSPATDVRGDTNPFLDLIGSLAVMSKCLQAFVTAELNGVNLPQRTSLTVLRSGPAITRNVEQAIRACVEWREEGVDGKSRPQLSSVRHLLYLLEAAHGVVSTIEDVAMSFQERVVVTMQKNTQFQVSSKDNDEEGKRSNSGSWSNELLRKTYRNQYQRRKALSRSEAKLLPFFTHSTERLKAFVTETAGTYRCELTHDLSAKALSRSLLSIRLGDDQLDGVLALLAASDGPVDVNSLETDATLEAKWSRLNPTEEGEQADVDESEDQSDGDEDESGGADDEPDERPVRRTDVTGFRDDMKLGAKRTTGVVHTLIPQKKRVKSS